MEVESHRKRRDILPQYRAIVQYDGTAFQGFQRQRRDVPTIQRALEEALEVLAGHPIRVTGAGRTDTGVHALGQVISFTIDWPDERGSEVLLRALNANLPADIAVSDIAEVEPGFHPRFDARRRTYEYRIFNGETRQPLLRDRAWHVTAPLNLERMKEGAALLPGVRDFATFGRAPVGQNTVREVFAAEWQARHEGFAELLVFRVAANAFLFRMVRSIVGALKLVGEGSWSVDQFSAALDARDRKQSASPAPAHGLYLVSVDYE